MTPFDQFLTALRTADEQATAGGLLPCPFCGSTSIHKDGKTVGNEDVAVSFCVLVCGDCGAQMIGTDETAEPELAAIAAWNRRPSRNSLAQTIAIMEVARKAIEDAKAKATKLAGHRHMQVAQPFRELLNILNPALAEIDALAAKTL